MKNNFLIWPAIKKVWPPLLYNRDVDKQDLISLFVFRHETISLLPHPPQKIQLT